MSTATTSQAIPSLYRIWFTTIDPILSLLGVFGNILTPNKILRSYTPFPAFPPATETIFLLDSMAGFLLYCTFLQLYLLRARPMDSTLWKALEFGTFLVDLAMLIGFGRLLVAEGRTNPGSWRVEEWVNMGIIAWCGMLRVVFCLGMGLNRHQEGTVKNRKNG